MAMLTASRLSTGSAPGSPRHTGQVLELGGSPKRVEQEQKIFDLVRSCTCTSSPITASYLALTSVATLISPHAPHACTSQASTAHDTRNFIVPSPLLGERGR